MVDRPQSNPRAKRPEGLAPLPMDRGADALVAALERAGAAVVLAPPGAGKTTRVPPLLLDRGLLGAAGQCLVSEPRRVAARAAARRVAAERGWEVGAEVGYQVRFERRATAATRLLFATEGILTARLQGDPFLDGVAAVVLDEFHERTLDADLALAFLREVRQGPRPDLRVLVLSATLDPGPVAAYLGAEVVEVAGRSHPVEITYLDRPDPAPLPGRVAAAVRRAWGERPRNVGDLLAFLPGAGEIAAVANRLGPWAQDVGARLVPLHGDLPGSAQDAALARSAAPRIVLATNVAETSVTVAGVVAVVDSGLAKVLRHDPGLGLDRLELEAISRASADQRAGRAGREGPGIAYRLWTRHEESGRPARAEPEVHRVDLGRAMLEVAAWGCPDLEAFPWLEAPAADRVAVALALLKRLGALDEGGALTPDGEALRRLPLPPRLGRLVLAAGRGGLAREGARLAALLAERDVLRTGRAFGPGGESPTGPSDLLHRLDLLEAAARAGFDSGRLESLGVDPGAARAVWRAAEEMEALARGLPGAAPPRAPTEEALLRLPLAAYPDRVARRRDPGSHRFVLAGGRGATLDPASGVRRAEFAVALRLDAGRRGERAEARIRWASEIDPAWLTPVATRTRVVFDPEGERVNGWEETTYEDLVLAERPQRPDPAEAARLLAAEAARDPQHALRPSPEARALVARCRFLARELPDLGFPAWDQGDWSALLGELCRGKTSFGELRRADLPAALLRPLSWPQRDALDREAPERVEVPSGSRLALAYPEDGPSPPVLAVKIQEVFGWAEGPRVARGRVAVLLHLLGPHGRPLQVTADLRSFWTATYPEVRKEMRGRYPRHRWPEDPWAALPTRRTTQPRKP